MKYFKFAALLMVLCLAMTGCGSKEEPTTEATTVEEPVDGGMGMVNPWQDCTEEEAKAECPHLFKAPDGAEDVKWSLMTNQAEGHEKDSKLVQMTFKLNGNEFCARAQQGIAESEEIHGMYYTWTATDDTTLANWGGGEMKAKTYRAVTDEEMADVITWYDSENSISYSLSVAAKDLDGFDIRAIAEQMYSGE